MISLNPHFKKKKKQMKMGGKTGELPGTRSTAEVSRNSTSAQWRDSAPDSPRTHKNKKKIVKTLLKSGKGTIWREGRDNYKGRKKDGRG